MRFQTDVDCYTNHRHRFSSLYFNAICQNYFFLAASVKWYKLTQFIRYYTDPYLNFFRRFIPPLGMIDFSPIIAFLCLSFIQNIVINFLVSFAK